MPSAVSRAGVQARMFDALGSNEELLKNMLRFIDVMPALQTDEELISHAQEYILDKNSDLGFLGVGAKGIKYAPKLAARTIKAISNDMAKSFISANGNSSFFDVYEKLEKKELLFTVDILGEAVVSEAEADIFLQHDLGMLEYLNKSIGKVKPREEKFVDRFGKPLINLSTKLTSKFSGFDPIAPDHIAKKVLSRFRPILKKAKEIGAFVNVDVEQYAYRDLTFDIIKCVLLEDEFKDFNDAGIVVQANLKDSYEHLEDFLGWCRDNNKRPTIRLVKGAYWDHEVTVAQRNGWDIPVFLKKHKTDVNFERCTKLLVDNNEYARGAFASHNRRSIIHALQLIKDAGLDKRDYEFQGLYGMQENDQIALAKQGEPQRMYCPVGNLQVGMAYNVRRLLENTSSSSWVRMVNNNYDPQVALSNPALVDGNVAEALVVADEKGRLARMYQGLVDFVLRRKARDVAVSSSRIYVSSKSGFTNARTANFSNLDERMAMDRGIEDVDRLVSKSDYNAFLMIGGSNRKKDGALYKEGKDFIYSINPATKEIFGKAVLASRGELEEAIDCAFDAKKKWASVDVSRRCEIVDRIGDKIENRKDYFASMIIREMGKNWREANADVDEAIDFCHFYANQMRKLGSEDTSLNQFVLGEENRTKYIPRGVTSVIAPFNFWAILVGMTTAALVAGNSVIVKPSPNAPIVAHEFSVLADSLLPNGVLNYVLCDNNDIEVLVNSPKINTIAFTGSSGVGQDIYKNISRFGAGQNHFKNAVIETGGKNGIIIDSSADLDEAVLGVRHSAFGYSGQKCSAASRVIVVGKNPDFVTRLIESTRSLNVGDSGLPHVDMGPVSSQGAFDKIKELYEQGIEDGARVIFPAKFDDSTGFYVGPSILEIDSSNVLASEEVFGPVLGVMNAKDFDEALRIMNDTRFALTAGIYSRTPSNIEKFKDEAMAGNIYVNRPCTGAVVERQPFGGFRMSGGGTKAGGVNYLMNFMYQVSISEEGSRRGHVPGIVEYVDGLE